MRGSLAQVLAIVLLAVAPARAASATKIKIVPGPATMSPEEAAIVADPAAGAQHGVVLLEETDRDESSNIASVVEYHMRAKILSPEGRSLANVEIPGIRTKGDLKNWWGKTILPSGEVRELAEKDLTAEATAHAGALKLTTMKGALPGVVPGCVIDFGYEVQRDQINAVERIALQKQWPVRLQRYRWRPATFYPASYVASRTDGKAVDIKGDRFSVLVTAKDLMPVQDEPYMPPMEMVRASVILYYTDSNEDPKEYWEQEGKDGEARVKKFVGNGSAIQSAIASMAIPPQASVEDKLKAAYAWIGANLKNDWLLSAEEEEKQMKPKDDEDDPTDTAKEVLAAKHGKGDQLDMLFIGMARSLGAQASLVYATDRREQFWLQPMKSMSQFGFTLVKVRLPQAVDFTMVDAGSGLAYGEVPWQATGVRALECTPKGFDTVLIPPAKAAANRGDTKVTLEFPDGDPSIGVKWSRSTTGAGAMNYRRWLRDLDPDDRKKELDELCGGKAGAYEVVRADLPGLTETSGPYQIGCDIELPEAGFDEATSRYSLDLQGPWWPVAPEFPSPSRTNNVVFQYPRVDTVTIDVKAPAGFKGATSPAPVRIDSPFGRYILQIRNTETGVHVDRMLALVNVVVEVPDYTALRTFLQDAAKHDRTSIVFDRAGAEK